MSEAALPLTDEDDGPLSPWWVRAVLIVMALGFSGLIAVTLLAYRNAPPIPMQATDPAGSLQFSGDDVAEGQAVFLKYGLMANGSIWGHGAYLGRTTRPRPCIEWAKSRRRPSRRRVTSSRFALTPSQQAAVRAEAAVELKTNRYDPVTGVLRLTASQATAHRELIEHWARYFHDPALNGGLQADLITDSMELRQFTAFVSWAAWASVATRPGEDYSYTNNFPYDPSVGKPADRRCALLERPQPRGAAGGIAVVLLAFGKFDYLGWVTRGHKVRPQLVPGQASAGQKALVNSSWWSPCSAGADPGGWWCRTLPRRPRWLLWLRS
jgi:nitric oxide reductase subunit B